MLYHFAIVRRDLPLGKLAAMLIHAAGESAAIYERRNVRFEGCPAVVLEEKNELALHRRYWKLKNLGIECVPVIESTAPFKDQLMAIGLVPIDKENLRGALDELQTLKVLEEAPRV